MKKAIRLFVLLVLAGLSGVRAQEEGLVMKFDFSNVSGTTVYDAVSSTLAASLKNNAKVQKMGTYAVANLGTANGYLDLTNKAGAIMAGLGDFTISCYYKVASSANITGAGNFLWSFSTSTACTQSAGIYHAYRVNAQRVATSPGGFGSEVGIQTGQPSNKGAWMHVAYTQAGKKGTLYVNGVSVGTSGTMPILKETFTSTPAYCWIGRAPFSADAYLANTLVYDFAVYDKALTAAQVAEKAKLTDDLDYQYRYGTAGDFTKLAKAVETAEAYLATAKASGKYPQAAIEDYEDVIIYSRNLIVQAAVNQEIIDAQVTVLNDAKKRLDAASGFVFDMSNLSTAYDTNRGFRHPGGLHTAADFERVRQQLADGNKTVTAAYDILRKAAYAQSTAGTSPVTTIVRGGGVGENYINAARGATIAYQNGLRWQIEGNKQCAQHAVDVLMAWARTTTGIGGDSNYALAAGLYGYQFAQAAELVRDYDGWAPEDFETFKRWMLDVWYPSAMGFMRGRNGTWENAGRWWQAPGHYWSNWGLCNAMCIISIGVLCDDVNIYNQGMSFIKYDQVGTFTDPRTSDPILNDGLTEFWGNLVVTTTEWDRETGAYGKVGQMNESGRDAGHAGMAVGLAIDVAHQGWNQGDDLFAYMDHRIAAGFEYLAAQSQNVTDLPWTNYTYGSNGIFYTDGRAWTMTEPALGAHIRPCWGTVIGIYEGVKGVKMPFSERTLQMMGIDGGGAGATSGGYDHLGYSVLMNTRDGMADRATAPVELQPQMIVGNKVIAHNELGALTNTFALTPEKNRGVARGTVITLSPTLPEGVEDTGHWRWDTGETTREITITADASYVYRVHYTNAYGNESEQSYAIAVLGDCQPTHLLPSIRVNNVQLGTTHAVVSYGADVDLTLGGLGGWSNVEWENGQKTETMTLHNVTHSRTITACLISQTGRRNYATFTLEVTPIIPSVVVGKEERSAYGEVCVDEGTDVTLNAPVADALRGGEWKWDDGTTADRVTIDSITTSTTRTVTYTVGGKAYDQAYTILVRPATPRLLDGDYYTIRLRNSDLYLTAYEKGDTARFAPLDADNPATQTWYIYRSSTKNPYYSFRLMNDSSFLSVQNALVASGVAKPHRLIFAAGTDLAYWYTTTNNVDSYVTVAESGLIDMKGSSKFTGYPFEVLRVDPTGIKDIVGISPAAAGSKGVYNLQGQRVQTMQRGRIYIVDGKKVMAQ